MSTLTVSELPNEILTIYSREAIFAAYPQLYFRQFVDVKSEYKEPGETVQFLKLANMNVGGEQLADELTPIQKEKYSDSTVSITANEYGKAIQYSKRAMEASFRNLMEDASVLLGRNYGQVLDGVLRDAYLATSNKIYSAGAVGAEVEGANTGDVATPFSAWGVKQAVEDLRTMNAPMITRGNEQVYVCIAHPHQLRNLRDDSHWINAYKYTSPDNIWNGEAGKYEGVVFLETTQMPILAGQGAGGANVYRSVVFGANAVGFGETVPFGLVNDGIEDFGRLVSIGWYSIFGAGIINDYIVELQTT